MEMYPKNVQICVYIQSLNSPVFTAHDSTLHKSIGHTYDLVQIPLQRIKSIVKSNIRASQIHSQPPYYSWELVTCNANTPIVVELHSYGDQPRTEGPLIPR